MLLRFGGHAAAAGCTIAEEHLDLFEQEFGADRGRMAGRGHAAAPGWRPTVRSTRNTATSRLVDILQQEVWGQGFAPPVFCEEVEIVSQRLVGGKHLQLKLRHAGEPVDGIWFNRAEPLPRVKLAYRLDVDEWQGAAAAALHGRGRRAVSLAVALAGGRASSPSSIVPRPLRRIAVPDGLSMLHADEALLVLDKPDRPALGAGRGPGNDDCLSARAQATYPDAPIVHRLDMGTSGLIVMARGPAAQSALSVASPGARSTKRYQAIVAGHPDDSQADEQAGP